jgi:hypothetical protein
VLCGSFSIIVGLLILISVFPLHMLYLEMADKWKPPLISRLPVIEDHEQMDFVFKCVRDEDNEYITTV